MFDFPYFSHDVLTEFDAVLGVIVLFSHLISITNLEGKDELQERLLIARFDIHGVGPQIQDLFAHFFGTFLGNILILRLLHANLNPTLNFLLNLLLPE